MERRCVGGGKRYCALCNRKQNEMTEDGEKITLHRIPGGQSAEETARRKAWLRGLKLHRPNVPITDSTRVCILHFEDKVYVKGQSIPKYYNLQKVPAEKRPRRPLAPRNIFSNVNDESLVSASEVLEKTERTTEFSNVEMNENNAFFDYDIDLFSSVEIETETELPEITETNHPELVDQAKPVHFIDHGYTLSVDSRDSASNVESEHIDSASANNVDIGIQTSLPKMAPEDIENNDEKTRFYTGFPNYATFMLFFTTFLKHGASKLTYWEGQKRTLGSEGRKYNEEHIQKPGRKRTLRPIDEFYMVCLRLRLGLLQKHLKDIFNVSLMTVSRVMTTWINFMFDHMKSLIPWPTREQILANLPRSFSELNQVRIVVDATEFFCEKPSSLIAQNLTWSEYKHHNTFKVLIGVAPNGLVTFISRVWGGHTSDRHIVQKHGDMLIPRLEPGDIILADKGFTVADLLPGDIGLNMPPFVSSSKQMTKEEFFKTQQIASPRIVVETKMEQINQRTNGPVDAHLLGLVKHKTWNIYSKEMTLTFNTHIPS